MRGRLHPHTLSAWDPPHSRNRSYTGSANRLSRNRMPNAELTVKRQRATRCRKKRELGFHREVHNGNSMRLKEQSQASGGLPFAFSCKRLGTHSVGAPHGILNTIVMRC